MKYNYAHIILLLLATVLLSCSREAEDIAPAAVKDPLVQEAMRHFEAQALPQNAPQAQATGQKHALRLDLIRNADWAKAKIRQLSIGKAVEVPLAFPKELYGKAGGSQTKLPLSGLARLLLYRNAAGMWQAEVVTRLPDAAYLSGTAPDMPFTGTVLVEDWQGTFLRGFRYGQDGSI